MSIQSFYTYIHRRNTDHKIFYVGKGNKLRLKQKANRNHKWHAVVNEHGFTPEVVAYFSNHDEAYEHERFLIWCFRDMGFDLANISKGGKGRDAPGKKHTEEHKKMMSEKYRGSSNPFFGKKHSEETLEKMRQHSSGVCRISDEVRKRMSEERKGVKRPASVGEKIRAARTGTKASAEARKKMSIARKGKKLSEETKEKRRLAQAKRFLMEKQNAS